MSQARKSQKAAGIAVVVAGLVVIGVSFLTLGRKGAAPARANPTGQPSPERQNSTRSSAEPAALSHTESIAQRIRGTDDLSVVHEGLRELRSALRTFPPAAASSVIQNFLDSKSDAPTHLPFKVGPNGFLTESPSLRVFLLDLLTQLDSKAAASCARRILETPTVPDEWAVALRTVAVADSAPETRAYLEQKLAEMLRHGSWVSDPSTGFLEAFDVAVYLGGTNLLSPLTELVRSKDNLAVAHAAYLALDRLTIADAAGTLAALQSNPELMAGREVTRANYFARADVRDTAQREVLENYLLNPALCPEELEKFTGLYPNANYMVSHNLLTRSVTPDGVMLAARDAEALRVTQQWLEDTRFVLLKPQLETVRRRLAMFVNQAKRSP